LSPINQHEFNLKFKRFVQGVISEDEFRRYLHLCLSKEDLIEIVMSGARGLKSKVAIGEPLDIKR
jgi:hypothetical protein